MTDSASGASSDAGSSSRDGADRGSLQVAAKAVERIATHAAQRVDGVLATGSSFDKLVGRRLPRASCELHADRVRVSVDIAVQWPLDLAEIASAVRQDVNEAVSRLTGMRVLAIDVSVTRIDRREIAQLERVK